MITDTLPNILTATKTESFTFNTKEIKECFDNLERKLDEVQQNDQDGFKVLVQAVNQLKSEIDNKKVAPLNPFDFYLKRDDGGYHADKSWKKIIEEGQKIQSEYWFNGEERLGKRFASPYGEGWIGSAVTPIIRIIGYEPEYWFRNTARLPGRFQFTHHAHFGGYNYFELNGEEVLYDDNGWGMQTNSPVCIYVESATKLDSGAIIRPFEQAIYNTAIVALNNGLPVYLSINPDRFWMKDVNIQQHQGSLVGIKHGLMLEKDWYPVEQIANVAVALPDPRFINLQMEGPFSNKRPQAAMMLSGLNGIISNLNLHGWLQGPLIFNDRNWVINGLTIDDGLKHNGSRFCSREEIVAYCISQAQTEKRSVVTGVVPWPKQWYLKKWSAAPDTAGFYQKGQMII